MSCERDFGLITQWISGVDWRETYMKYFVGKQKINGIQETQFDVNNSHVRLVDISQQSRSKRKWLQQFTDVDILFLFCDISCFYKAKDFNNAKLYLREVAAVLFDILKWPETQNKRVFVS
jgi:hypothetical protein